MTNPRYDSLRTKLVRPFVLLGLVVSALLSATTFLIVAELEHLAVDRMLHVEIESFRNRKQQSPDALPPVASLVHAYTLPSPELPSMRLPAPGAERRERIEIADRDYAVIVADVLGVPYALLYDLEYVDARLARLAGFLLVGTVLMTLLSYLVGNRLAQQVVRPIGKLLSDLSLQAGEAKPGRDAAVVFSAADYPGNEIGHLVQALDQFALRLYGFVKRESYFASDVSHELRTPIAVIRGAAEVLVDTPGLPPPVKARLQTIHRHAVRMGELLEAMLLLARESDDRGDPSCALAEIIDDVIADCRPLLEGRPVAFEVSIRERAVLPVERSLAYVVVSNLVRNACAYTRQGSITITLHAARLEISDTGIGIPDDRLPELFERHSKGAESAGAGLGLSIVARVAEMLDWRVEIDSRRGEGTRVVVHFPPTEPAGKAATAQ